jgi:hypothetical protein
MRQNFFLTRKYKTMSFTDIALFDVSFGLFPALGRANVMWTVTGGAPASFELAIQQDGVNLPGRVYELLGGESAKLFLDLPNGDYVAVLAAKDANALVIKAKSEAFSVARATNVSGLAAACNAATGAVSVTFTPIAGYTGNYTVSCAGVSQDVATSPAVCAFVTEGSKSVSISASIDGFALNDTTIVQVDRKVVFSSFTVNQSAAQAKQGKATVAYATLYADDSTKYALEVSGGTWSNKVADTANGAVIDMLAGIYDFRLVATNTSGLDNGEMAHVSAKAILKNAAFTDAAALAGAAGIITVSSSNIGATGVDYMFDISGAEQNQVMSLVGGKYQGTAVKLNGAYDVRVKVSNNGATVMSSWLPVSVAKTTVIGSLEADEKMYAGLGKVELKWSHSQSAAACVYTAKLLKAADRTAVHASSPLSLAAGSAAGAKSLEVSALEAGAYIARLEVVINGSTFHDEVIVYLENAPLAMNLLAFAANRSDDSNLTNPHDLWFTRATGLAGSLFAYQWSLAKLNSLSGPSSGIVNASAGLRFDLPRTSSLSAGSYTLTVSTMLYGVQQTATKSFMVGGVAHKAVIVDLGVALDARADASVIDAAEEIQGNIVEVKAMLPAAALYSDVSDGLIEFWEPIGAVGEISARFTVNAQGAAEPQLYNGLAHAKDLVMGIQDCLVGGLDCSIAEPFARMNSEAYDQFATVGDMTLAYIADKLFGHPAATAAITNDAMIKQTMNAAPAASAAALQLGPGSIATPELNTATAAGNQKLALRLVQTMLFDGGVARAKRIAESVIGQDADRARDADNNELVPEHHAALPFYADDVIFFTLNLKSLDVFQGRIGAPVYQQLKARLADQSFVFKITLA